MPAKKTTARKATPKVTAKKATPKKRLAEYTAKRDFAKTPEPAGGHAPEAGDRPRFVVQRHRARALHYDFRLEMGGVLASWAIPKGPSLDPKVKRLGVHVEDHPVEYFDFEGVIPRGEYGGGDVIVWDWGTYEAVRTDDPVQAVADGELHVDLYGEKLHGRLVLIRRGENKSGKEQWLVFHKKDEFAVAGWDAEQFPKSVRSGRTNDEVQAQRDAVWRSDAPAALAGIDFSSTGADIAALDALGKEGDWEFDGVTLHVTNLDKVLFPGRTKAEKPLTKRDLIRYYAMVAPVMVPYLDGRPLNLNRFPQRCRQARLLAQGGAVPRAGVDHAVAQRRRRRRRDRAVLRRGPTRDACVARELRRRRAPRVDVARSRRCAKPTYAMIDIDPGEKTTWEQVLTMTGLYKAALDHMKVRGFPKVTGQRGIQIWVPIEPGPGVRRHAAWVEALSRLVGETVPELVSWKWEKRGRGGLARLDYTQNAINKTLVAPYSVRPAAGAPVSMPITWAELDDPELRSDRWTIRDAGARLLEVGDLFADVLTTPQQLPPL